jgi:hypothetical protein
MAAKAFMESFLYKSPPVVEDMVELDYAFCAQRCSVILIERNMKKN